MKTKRKYYTEIDLLKAFAALLVVFIHVISNYTKESNLYYLTWDLVHFSVGAFVFASGFLMANGAIIDRTPLGIIKLLWKKYKRIVVPYYTFAILFLSSLIIVDGWQAVSSKFSIEYFTKTLFIYGGVEYDWIPRLFMILSIIYVFAELIKPVFKYIYHLLSVLALAIVLFFLKSDSSILPLLQNIPGWFIIFMVGYFLQKRYSKFKEIAVKTSILSGGILAITYMFLSNIEKSISIITNKYPPNLYFVAYNILLITITLIILRFFAKIVLTSKLAKAVTKFYSYASYDMFFYHLIVLKFLENMRLGLLWDYIIAIGLTTLVIYIKQRIENNFSALTVDSKK